ncbi:MAG: tRNA (N6-threonylcarbamoyladenosine(37)-N6)-methyltransferase TrmO [Nibricoccus sp.]
MEISLRPVARLRTPFHEKFGVPRQSGLVPSAEGRVEFLPEFAAPEFVRGLEAFSHVWLVTGFDRNPPWSGSAVVRPPRLGGNERIGVFASRAPNRPNGLGLSLVKLLALEPGALRVGGVDSVDDTPVYDVKPYLPWCEALSDARADWANSPPPLSEAGRVVIPAEFEERLGPDTLNLIREVLRLELAPAYQDDAARTYGVSLAGWNIRWRLNDDGTREVCDVQKL